MSLFVPKKFILLGTFYFVIGTFVLFQEEFLFLLRTFCFVGTCACLLNILKKFKTFFWIFLAIIQNIVSGSHTFFTSQSNGTFWNVFKQILQEHFKTFKTFFKHFKELPKTLWVVLKHFSLHFEMFTNLFGNFLNV